jgi:hypothetical protein
MAWKRAPGRPPSARVRANVCTLRPLSALDTLRPLASTVLLPSTVMPQEGTPLHIESFSKPPIMNRLPTRSRFLIRPQLLTRC